MVGVSFSKYRYFFACRIILSTFSACSFVSWSFWKLKIGVSRIASALRNEQGLGNALSNKIPWGAKWADGEIWAHGRILLYAAQHFRFRRFFLWIDGLRVWPQNHLFAGDKLHSVSEWWRERNYQSIGSDVMNCYIKVQVPEKIETFVGNNCTVWTVDHSGNRLFGAQNR